MYQQHFGLSEFPFGLTPDTGYFFRYADHQEALNVLLVALRMGEGFIKVTGEVGTGKTLICRKLLNTLSSEGMVTAYLPNPCLSATGLRHALADELGIQFARNIGQHRVLKLIDERLIQLRASGQRVVVLLDEAQALPQESLEAIRLLTNLETEKSKLLQVVLFGQPELNAQLERSSVRQLKQRITFSYHLRPMSRQGTGDYLRHRLAVAGCSDEALFSARAVNALYRGSRGIPRLINILSHKALMAAYGEGVKRVGRIHVKRAIADTEDTSHGRWSLRALWYGLAGLSVSTMAGAGVFMLTGVGG